jgi:hypothetical protein
MVIFVVAIIGTTYVSSFEDSFNVFTCAIMIAFDGIVYGGGTYSGTNFIKDGLNVFANEKLDDIVNESAKFTGVPAWATDDIAVMDTISGNMKTVCSEATCGFNQCPTGSGEACNGMANWSGFFVSSYTYTANTSVTLNSTKNYILFN